MMPEFIHRIPRSGRMFETKARISWDEFKGHFHHEGFSVPEESN